MLLIQKVNTYNATNPTISLQLELICLTKCILFVEHQIHTNLRIYINLIFCYYMSYLQSYLYFVSGRVQLCLLALLAEVTVGADR
jgi:hypothetical protein